MRRSRWVTALRPSLLSGACIVLGLLMLIVGPRAQVAENRAVVLLDIQGPIGPATSDYLSRGIADAEDRRAAFVIVRMDTPGGLDTSMREIIRGMLAATLPIVVYVPNGGRAASAGTYILYAAHVAAMAPGTSLGAATPVQIGGGRSPFPLPGRGDPAKEDKKDAPKTDAKRKPEMADKMMNDAAAYIRGLAEMRGRNVAWAEKAVREAASLSAAEALRENVIDLVAENIDTLLARLDGRIVKIDGKTVTLATASLAVRPMSPDWRSEFLAIITNPNVAYILMMIGIYGVIFEFYSPGMIFPGVIGVICLLLALYAFHVLPISYAGLALTLVGIALMTAEAFVPSIGVLGIGGLIAFVIGSVMLIDTSVPGYGISWPLIGAIALTLGVLFLLSFALLVRSRARAVVSGPEEMLGSEGKIVDWDGHEGHVRVHGEMWRARAKRALRPGRRVRVSEMDGLTLVVEPDTSERRREDAVDSG